MHTKQRDLHKVYDGIKYQHAEEGEQIGLFNEIINLSQQKHHVILPVTFYQGPRLNDILIIVNISCILYSIVPISITWFNIFCIFSMCDFILITFEWKLVK